LLQSDLDLALFDTVIKVGALVQRVVYTSITYYRILRAM